MVLSAAAAVLTGGPKPPQAHAAFQLTSVAAAAAVTATRQASSPAGTELRDLLVLHRGGQLALYVGRQRMFDVRVQASPPSGISVEPGFGQTGGACLRGKRGNACPRRSLVPCLLLECGPAVCQEGLNSVHCSSKTFAAPRI